MAVPILRLNIDDNPRIIVKQDSIPVTITGYTQTIVQGSGATTVTESGVNPKIYTVYTPIGSAQWGSILGDVTTQTDLTDYVTQSISAATSGLTSSWNDLTDKPSWLSGATLNDFENAHSHSQYLTGFTVTAPMVTGITASLYAPIYHTHSYTGGSITDLPTLFTGHTFVASGGTIIGVSGDVITIYSPTGSSLLWGAITGDINSQTDLITLLSDYVDFDTYNVNNQILSDYLDNLPLALSGMTDVTLTSPTTNDTILYNGTAWVNSPAVAALSGLTDVYIESIQDFDTLVYNSGTTKWENEATVDILQYVGDNQLFARSGTTIVGVSQNTFAAFTSTIVSLTASTILDDTYANKIVEVDFSGNTTITLPSGMTTGMKLDIVNVNTGDVTIAAQGTLQGVGTILATQYTKAEAYHRGSDVWLITGTLTS